MPVVGAAIAGDGKGDIMVLLLLLLLLFLLLDKLDVNLANFLRASSNECVVSATSIDAFGEGITTG